MVSRAGYLERKDVADRAEGDPRLPGRRSHWGHPHSQFWPHVGQERGRGGGKTLGDPGLGYLLTPKLKLGSQSGQSQPPGDLALGGWTLGRGAKWEPAGGQLLADWLMRGNHGKIAMRGT